MEINLSSVNLDLYKSIAKLQPYGMGNPKPKFLIRNCIKNFVKPAAEIHLIVYLNDMYGNSIKSIAFNSSQTQIGKLLNDDDSKELDIICTLQLNRWNGEENVELIIEDILKR
jgi:single-stranded-DNA-specific exonuclease